MLIAQEYKTLEREKRERDARFAKYMTQTEACIQLHDGDEKGINDCINRLKITDPDFARGYAEAHDPQAQKEFTDAWTKATDREQ